MSMYQASVWNMGIYILMKIEKVQATEKRD